ncbi:hypothetical protein AtEden1_Chr2g0232661 [Arabidopsis thaliana]
MFKICLFFSSLCFKFVRFPLMRERVLFGLLLVVSSDLLLCLVLRAVWEDSQSLSGSTGCCAQMFEFVVGWGFATRLLLRLVRLRVPERTLFLSWEAIGRVVNISTIAWLVIDEAAECASKKTSYGFSYEVSLFPSASWVFLIYTLQLEGG